MLVAIALLAVAAPSASPTRAIYGSARVADGDTLTINGERLRLFGIDAPELDQTCMRNGQAWHCGREAAERLSRLVVGKSVRCLPNGTDDFGRTLARCDLIGVDINEAMVASGYAVAFRRYSADYVAVEERAKAARRGMWSGTFKQPSEYRFEQRAGDALPRSAKRRASPPQVRFAGGCVIKGNRSRRGEWIYHLPGMPYYEQTRPEEIFCSEAAAQAAGYRRAIVR